MDRVETNLYRSLLGTIGDIPPRVVDLHERFMQRWKKVNKGLVPVEIAALIVAIADREPCNCKQAKPTKRDKRVTVNGKPGTYISKWRAGTVRVKFDGDEKAFRVVDEASVKYE